jgi:hypothetical protein
VPAQGIDIHMQHYLTVLRAPQSLQDTIVAAGSDEVLGHFNQRIGPGLAVSFLTLGGVVNL